MSKFKIGDKVVRKSPDDRSPFKKHQGDFDYYTVTAMTSSGHWLQLDNFTIDYDCCPWYAPNFKLYQEPDDELPPVPASVAYMNSKRDHGNDQRLVLERCSWTDENLLYIGVVPRKNSTRAEREIGINMSPDAALQLAHDLRRMAMDIKRKGKAHV
ncbi:hypothetical protein CPT_Minorna_047 [Escherichia phage Minorna]|uniref:Uncharacterized protein n=1 Tax=Escherichia phage Minorna TaxID=2547246 RepID=A0A482IEJ8_9CAUD|nr:hypothetical protein HOV29_gp47 [Escherichia phage Minorna]QBP07098.1 hypothetical protein CPT_Minorna_047 [Escherichia phage Minorna]